MPSLLALQDTPTSRLADNLPQRSLTSPIHLQSTKHQRSSSSPICVDDFIPMPISVDAFIGYSSLEEDDDNNRDSKRPNPATQTQSSQLLPGTDRFAKDDCQLFDHELPRCHCGGTLGTCLVEHAKGGHAQEAASVAAELSLTLNMWALQHIADDDNNNDFESLYPKTMQLEPPLQ